jgi:MoxR-like ATPase
MTAVILEKKSDSHLEDSRQQALRLMQEVQSVIVGQERAIKLMTIAIFARGHVLLEGDVGVGKTTLLRAITRGIGGKYERIEGTVDLMPNDLVYHTYIGEDARPHVEPGPLLRSGEDLSVFFFNEINRARPQVHALMLRVMTEQTIHAFKREFRLPHMLVFADRNQVEKDETFDIPSAARDRFMMEIPIMIPSSRDTRKSLVFNTRFHNTENLTASVAPNILAHDKLNALAVEIQEHVSASPVIEDYTIELWEATQHPESYGVRIADVEMAQLIKSGASPRGMAMMLKAAKVHAWLMGRNAVIPEDVHAVFHETIAHRLVFTSMYEGRRTMLARELTNSIVRTIAVP